MTESASETLEQLIYVGSASHLFSDQELLTLLKESRRKHEKLNVSGLLVYSEGTFIQVLEGPEEILSELYKSIQHDQRYHRCFVLLRQKIVERVFEGWSMGFRNPTNCDAENVAGYLDFFGDCPVPERGAPAYRLLNSFRRQHDRELEYAIV